MGRLPTWVGPGKLRRTRRGFNSLSGVASFGLDASAQITMSGAASLALDASATSSTLLSQLPSKLRPPQWVGPGKLRGSPRGISLGPQAIAGTIGFTFGASASPSSQIQGIASMVFGATLSTISTYPLSKLRPPQWVGPGKLRSTRRGISPPPPGPIAGVATMALDAKATVTRISTSFKGFVSPKIGAPYNPLQFTPRPPAYNVPGPIVGVAGILFGTAGTLSSAASGTCSFALDASGNLTGSILIDGSSAFALDATGTAIGGGQLTGITSISFAAQAAYSQGPLAGIAAFSLDAGANLGSDISGVADMSFDASGTMYNASAPFGSASITFSAIVNSLTSDPCYIVKSRGQITLKSC
jgi:hypothetical protein